MTSLLKQNFIPDVSSIYDQKLANQLAVTHGAIGSLNQMSHLLLNPNLLMRPILAKEAEASSQLEGTQASIVDVYKIDITEQTFEEKNEAIEIRNYEEAMLTGLDILNKTNNKISHLLIREIHKRLMSGVRGKDKHPGEYRRDQVWVGPLGTSMDKARYLPPAPEHVSSLMDKLDDFMKNNKDLHPLIACGIIHHRFEAIHPFDDGNGRTGRLLISLFLISRGLLEWPILYPSGYFEKNKSDYINALNQVDKNESWYDWFIFFLEGLEYQANLSLKISLTIDNQYKESKRIIENERANIGLLKVLEHTFIKPYITSSILNKYTGLPRPSCDRYLQSLSKHKIIDDLGIIKRQRVFVNSKLIGLLQAI